VTDEEAVSAMETLLQRQQAPTTPWVPVTDYSRDARRVIEGPHPRLIREVFAPLDVLDVGCGPGHLLEFLRELGILGAGLDVQRFDGGPARFHQRSILDSVRALPRFDLVICREMLEHLTLRQLRQAVHHLAALTGRYLYITTRFCQSPTHLLSVDTSDDLDPTHITMLTKPFLRLLCVLEGCRSRPDLETRMDWRKLGRCLVFERCHD